MSRPFIRFRLSLVGKSVNNFLVNVVTANTAVDRDTPVEECSTTEERIFRRSKAACHVSTFHLDQK
jgi:hypothetical protein